MAAKKEHSPRGKAYATRNTTLIVTFICLCLAFLAVNVEERFPLPLLVRVVMWGMVIAMAVSVTMLAYTVFPRRHTGKRPSEITDIPEIFTARQLVLAECSLLIILVGMALFVILVPPYLEPASHLRQLRGHVTECRPKRGDFSMTVRQDGKESLVRVHPFLTEQLSSIAVGDEIIALMDGAYATELRWNGVILFTYDDYRQNMRRFARTFAGFYALAAFGFGMWLRYKAKKTHAGARELGDKRR